jgi:hypothetical protein
LSSINNLLKKLYETVLLIFFSIIPIIIHKQIVGIDGTDTRLLWQPAISKDRIAFIYAEGSVGSQQGWFLSRRITSSEGIRIKPRVFS